MRRANQLFCIVLFLALGWLYFQQKTEIKQSEQNTGGKPRVYQKEIMPRLVDYKMARKVFWQKLYPDKGNTLYCGQPFTKKKRAGINIEHVFPMSWVKNSFDCKTRKQCRNRYRAFNQIEADLHNLYPSRSDINQIRSSFSFAEIKGEKRRADPSCDFEVDYYARKVEPSAGVRGDVARAMFYMVYQYQDYGLKLFPKQQALLLKWHERDLPDKSEKKRNNKIIAIQGSSNPFIVNPALVRQYFLDGELNAQ